MRYVMILAASLLAVTDARSQSADSVPRELALALLREPGGGIRLFVGTTPERYAFELAPHDSKLLGAAQRELTATVVYVSKATPIDAQYAWEKQVERAGWTRPLGYAPVAMNGFISSTASPDVPVFCSNGRFASLSAITRFDGGSTLLVQYSEPSMQSLCSTSRAAAAADAQLVVTQDTMPLPALLPPDGVTVVALPARTTVDSWEQQAGVSGTLSPKAVLEHYATQLRKAGFSPSTLASLDATATQTFRRTLPQSGFELFVSLVVIANPFDTTTMEARLTLFRRR